MGICFACEGGEVGRVTLAYSRNRLSSLTCLFALRLIRFSSQFDGTRGASCGIVKVPRLIHFASRGGPDCFDGCFQMSPLDPAIFADFSIAEPLSLVWQAAQQTGVTVVKRGIVVGCGRVGLLGMPTAQFGPASPVYLRKFNEVAPEGVLGDSELGVAVQELLGEYAQAFTLIAAAAPLLKARGRLLQRGEAPEGASDLLSDVRGLVVEQILGEDATAALDLLGDVRAAANTTTECERSPDGVHSRLT